MSEKRKAAKKLMQRNKDSFFDDVETGVTYAYSESFGPQEVEELAADNGYNAEYTNEVEGCLGFILHKRTIKQFDDVSVMRAQRDVEQCVGAITILQTILQDGVEIEDEEDVRTEIHHLRKFSKSLNEKAEDLWDKANEVFGEQ